MVVVAETLIYCACVRDGQQGWANESRRDTHDGEEEMASASSHAIGSGENFSSCRCFLVVLLLLLPGRLRHVMEGEAASESGSGHDGLGEEKESARWSVSSFCLAVRRLPDEEEEEPGLRSGNRVHLPCAVEGLRAAVVKESARWTGGTRWSGCSCGFLSDSG